MLLLSAAVSASERPRSVIDLTVHWVDAARQLESARGSVKERVEAIFETASIRIRWSSSGTDIPKDAIAVIFLLDPPQAPCVPGRAMGVMTDDENRRFVYVYVNPVLRGAGLAGPVRSLTTDEGVIFSRALSRVVAHEIIHSVLPGGDHAESGIMSATLTPTLLQRAWLDLDERTKCRIQHALGAGDRCELAPGR
jgi:hypothetical protein